MVNVPIHEELFEPIRRLAEQEQTSVEGVVNDWLRRQLALVREQKIKEESARFRSRHAALLAQYRGEYVAMRNGEVLDHASDARELYLRIKAHYGDDPILIAPVTETPTQTYTVRQPRLIRPAT
jgi:hypothetical protein